MAIENKISQLDSLERMELELELDKKIEKLTNDKFRNSLKRSIPLSTDIELDFLVSALDQRYAKKS